MQKRRSLSILSDYRGQAINSERKSVEIILDEDLSRKFKNSKDVSGNLWGFFGKANLRKTNY